MLESDEQDLLSERTFEFLIETISTGDLQDLLVSSVWTSRLVFLYKLIHFYKSCIYE